ncbi:MAG TPA: hypothetical protein VG674_10415 [Amycolatopsis sp.]|nr:hypothetical protein [Amycolatopsis sp.]
MADLLIDLGARLDAGEIAEVEVHTHALAAGLDRTTWHNQLSAMFSVPFVAATALLHGAITPRYTALTPEEAPELARLAQRVRIFEDPELTKKLPDNRAARVHVRLADGSTHTVETENPIGDTDFQPFDRDQLTAVFSGLLEQAELRTIDAVVDGLTATRARALLAPLAG